MQTAKTDQTGQMLGAQDQDQDQDSLLVKRRNDNHSPGPVIRELVPSSQQRSELSNTILCIFSGRVLLVLVQTLLTCVFHLKSLVIVTPRYLMLSTFSRLVPSKVYEAWIFLIRFLVSCIILHLTG